MQNVKFAKFGEIESVKKLVSKKTAAVILEPIQSIAGVNEAEPSFYIALRKLCKEKKIVLIFDEVQTGLGRCGKLFYGEYHGIMPDLLTLAKGMAGGLPSGAVLVSRKIAKTVEIGDQGCTFGGGPVVCAAICATVEIIKKEKLVQNAAKLGNYLKLKIKKLPHVLAVLGKGLLLGIKLDISAKEIQKKVLEKGVITGTSDNPNVLRIMPPLTITKKEADLFLGVLSDALKEF